MSNKKKQPQLPDGAFTWSDTDVNTFGLGFEHDTTDSDPRMRARVEGVVGVADLPPGFLVEQSRYEKPPWGPAALRSAGESLNTGSFVDVRQLMGSDDATLADFNWLHPNEIQDPNRLPTNPVDKTLEELRYLWKQPTTNGLQPINAEALSARTGFTLSGNNQDLNRARYEASLDAQPTLKKTASQLRQVVQDSMRKSAAGVSFVEIQRSVLGALGNEAFRVRRPLTKVAQEHGLAGKVFIRALAYPGCHNGKWTQHVQKVASESRYLVGSSKCRACVHNQRGACQIFKKRLVASVPWQEALQTYGQVFATRGINLRELADNPLEALKVAFVTPSWKGMPQTLFPIHHEGVERQEHQLLVRRENQMAQAFQQRLAKQEEQARQPVQAFLRSAVNNKLLTPQEAHHVAANSKTVHEARDMTEQIDMHRPRSQKVYADYGMRHRDYNFKQFPSATMESQHIDRIASAAGVTPIEVKTCFDWLAVEMNHGLAGRNLDAALNRSFSPRLLQAAAQDIADLRHKHEGLAGHLYIDAATYGAERGVRGCDEGAAQHRQSGVPYVLKMAACDGCTFKNPHGMCRKYAKPLVEGFDPAELDAFRSETLRKANGFDYSQAPSLLHPTDRTASDMELQAPTIDRFLGFLDRQPEPDPLGLDVLNQGDIGLWLPGLSEG